MAKLHISDGKVVEVSQEQAQAIYSVLTGTTKPQNATQAAFCEKVSNVTFDEEKPHTEDLGKGYASFQRVGTQLKERVTIQE